MADHRRYAHHDRTRLRALYQVPHDLPQGMLTLLMQLNAPHEEE